MTDAGREFDLVLLGATGFVGRLTAAHLAAAAPAGTRIALAGRSIERLRAVSASLGGAAADWPLIEADSLDDAAMESLAGRARVIATTVGPYRRLGMPLVLACAAAGTHYCDLTGEVLFVHESIARAHGIASASGARIVHSCGFDSVPSDLGVLATVERARADDAGGLQQTTLRVRTMRGGLSGGTIDSMRQQMKEAASDSSARAILADPFSLGGGQGDRGDRGDRERKASGLAGALATLRHGIPVHRDDATGRWLAPFIMAGYNTRIVRRSNALADPSYGRSFRYREFVDVGTGVTAPLKGGAMAAVIGGVGAGLAFGPTRALLDRALPKPGDGPSEEQRRQGRFRMEIDAVTDSGRRYRTTVAAPYDPGYNGTAIMLGQSALSLAFDPLPDRAGVLTPAVALGDSLTERLRAHHFEIGTSIR